MTQDQRWTETSLYVDAGSPQEALERAYATAQAGHPGMTIDRLSVPERQGKTATPGLNIYRVVVWMHDPYIGSPPPKRGIVDGVWLG